jgi:hypothetical protein
MMKEILLNVAGIGTESTVGKVLQGAKRRAALSHGSKDPGNPNVYWNRVESLIREEQDAVGHLSPHTGQEAKLAASFIGRSAFKRVEVDLS